MRSLSSAASLGKSVNSESGSAWTSGNGRSKCLLPMAGDFVLFSERLMWGQRGGAPPRCCASR
jgi:hypothetical protein